HGTLGGDTSYVNPSPSIRSDVSQPVTSVPESMTIEEHRLPRRLLPAAHTGHRWAVVLAGGEGRQLQSLTTLGCGTPVPKQFCSLSGGRTLLEDALTRAEDVVGASR